MYGNILLGSLQGEGWDFCKERKKNKWDVYGSREDKSLTHLFFFLLTFFHCSLRVLLLLFKNDRERELFIFNFFSIYCYKTVYRTYFLNLYRVKKATKYTPSNSDPLRVTIQLFGKSLVTLIFLSLVHALLLLHARVRADGGVEFGFAASSSWIEEVKICNRSWAALIMVG